MVFSSTLLLAAALVSQHPTAEQGAAPALSPEEVARLESVHLTNIRQVSYGLARAGEGYFSPDGRSIIFQAVPHVAPSIFHHPLPDEDGYQIFLGPLEEDGSLKMVSTGKGRCTCPFFHPEREVDPVCLDASLSQHRRRAAQEARHTAARRVIAGSFPRRWISSPPTPMART